MSPLENTYFSTIPIAIINLFVVFVIMIYWFHSGLILWIIHQLLMHDICLSEPVRSFKIHTHVDRNCQNFQIITWWSNSNNKIIKWINICKWWFRNWCIINSITKTARKFTYTFNSIIIINRFINITCQTKLNNNHINISPMDESPDSLRTITTSNNSATNSTITPTDHSSFVKSFKL